MALKAVLALQDTDMVTDLEAHRLDDLLRAVANDCSSICSGEKLALKGIYIKQMMTRYLKALKFETQVSSHKINVLLLVLYAKNYSYKKEKMRDSCALNMLTLMVACTG